MIKQIQTISIKNVVTIIEEELRSLSDNYKDIEDFGEYSTTSYTDELFIEFYVGKDVDKCWDRITDVYDIDPEKTIGKYGEQVILSFCLEDILVILKEKLNLTSFDVFEITKENIYFN